MDTKPIAVADFTGMRGYLVAKDDGNGMLDEGDTVVHDGVEVAFADPAFASARDEFVRVNADLDKQERDFAAANTKTLNLDEPTLQAIFDRRMAEGADLTRSPRIRARTYTQASCAEGLIASSRILFWNKAEPGKAALRALHASVAADPTYVTPHFAYAIVLLAMSSGAFQGKKEELFESVTNQDLKTAVLSAIGELERFPGDVYGQTALRALYARAIEKQWGDVSAENAAMLAVDKRLVTLRAAHGYEGRDAQKQIDSI